MVCNKLTLFDFDGVICDSAFEAFRIMLTTIGKINNPFSDKYDFKYNDFYKKRMAVGPAWNYYYVALELFDNKWEPWIESEKTIKFSEDFFNCRRQAQEKTQDWLLLNPLYPGISNLLLGKDISILTNKNYEPVCQILDANKIQYDKVYSMQDNVYFKSKVDFMNATFSDKKIKFIDDHLDIVSDVIGRAIFEVDARHATWGYTDRFLDGISLEFKRLENWLND